MVYCEFHNARINFYIKASYKEPIQAVSEVIQFTIEHDKLQQKRWSVSSGESNRTGTDLGHLTFWLKG